jgi:hypothetical protein
LSPLGEEPQGDGPSFGDAAWPARCGGGSYGRSTNVRRVLGVLGCGATPDADAVEIAGSGPPGRTVGWR